MRSTATTTAMMAAACLLVLAPAAWAGTPSTPEIPDSVGDVGPAPVGLGPAGAEADIVKAWFATDRPAADEADRSQGPGSLTDGGCFHPCGEGAGGTWALMEVASFEARPPHVIYAVAYEEGNASVWVAYGRIIDPAAGGTYDGFYGCRSADEHDEAAQREPGLARHGDCQELDGEILADGSGVKIRIPDAWAPGGATLTATQARTYLLPPPVPEAGELIWEAAEDLVVLDEAGPGEDYRVPEPPAQDRSADNASIVATQTGEAQAGGMGQGTLVLGGLGVLAVTGATAAVWRRAA